MLNFVPFTGYPYSGSFIDCPICGADNHERIAKFDRRLKFLSTHICKECGLLFTNPMPTDAELNKFYASTYRAEYQFAFLRPRKTHQRKKQKEAKRRVARMNEIIGLTQERRFLDFGCGSGEIVREIATRGCEAHGFEQGADYGSFAQDKLAEETGGKSAIRVGSWRDMDYAAKSFDGISCLHVLEHLNEPIAALQRMYEWLADDGVLYLETPDMQNYVLKGFDCLHFAHVLGFSRDNLLHAADQAGFRLYHEDGPTSFFLVKMEDPRGMPQQYDLAATAQKNHQDYSSGITLKSYIKRHTRRINKVVRAEMSQE